MNNIYNSWGSLNRINANYAGVLRVLLPKLNELILEQEKESSGNEEYKKLKTPFLTAVEALDTKLDEVLKQQFTSGKIVVIEKTGFEAVLDDVYSSYVRLSAHRLFINDSERNIVVSKYKKALRLENYLILWSQAYSNDVLVDEDALMTALESFEGRESEFGSLPEYGRLLALQTIDRITREKGWPNYLDAGKKIIELLKKQWLPLPAGEINDNFKKLEQNLQEPANKLLEIDFIQSDAGIKNFIYKQLLSLPALEMGASSLSYDNPIMIIDWYRKVDMWCKERESEPEIDPSLIQSIRQIISVVDRWPSVRLHLQEIKLSTWKSTWDTIRGELAWDINKEVNAQRESIVTVSKNDEISTDADIENQRKIDIALKQAVEGKIEIFYRQRDEYANYFYKVQTLQAHRAFNKLTKEAPNASERLRSIANKLDDIPQTEFAEFVDPLTKANEIYATIGQLPSVLTIEAQQIKVEKATKAVSILVNLWEEYENVEKKFIGENKPAGGMLHGDYPEEEDCLEKGWQAREQRTDDVLKRSRELALNINLIGDRSDGLRDVVQDAEVEIASIWISIGLRALHNFHLSTAKDSLAVTIEVIQEQNKVPVSTAKSLSKLQEGVEWLTGVSKIEGGIEGLKKWQNEIEAGNSALAEEEWKKLEKASIPLACWVIENKVVMPTRASVNEATTVKSDDSDEKETINLFLQLFSLKRGEKNEKASVFLKEEVVSTLGQEGDLGKNTFLLSLGEELKIPFDGSLDSLGNLCGVSETLQEKQLTYQAHVYLDKWLNWRMLFEDSMWTAIQGTKEIITYLDKKKKHDDSSPCKISKEYLGKIEHLINCVVDIQKIGELNYQSSLFDSIMKVEHKALFISLQPRGRQSIVLLNLSAWAQKAQSERNRKVVSQEKNDNAPDTLEKQTGHDSPKTMWSRFKTWITGGKANE